MLRQLIFSLQRVSLFIIVLFLLSLGRIEAQDVNPDGVAQVSKTGAQASDEQIIIVPVLEEFGSLSSLFGRRIYESLLANNPEFENNVEYIIGRPGTRENVGNISNDYLVKNKYTIALLVSVVSPKQAANVSDNIYGIEIFVFYRGATVPAYHFTFEDTFNNIIQEDGRRNIIQEDGRRSADILSTSSLAFKNSEVIKKISDAIKAINILLNQVNYSEIHINAGQDILPKYELRIKDRNLAVDYDAQIAYVPVGEYYVEVYQLLSKTSAGVGAISNISAVNGSDKGSGSNAEILVGSFRTNLVEKKYYINIPFRADSEINEREVQPYKKSDEKKGVSKPTIDHSNRTTIDINAGYAESFFSSQSIENSTSSLYNSLQVEYSFSKSVPVYVGLDVSYSFLLSSFSNPSSIFSISPLVYAGYIQEVIPRLIVSAGIGGGMLFYSQSNVQRTAILQTGITKLAFGSKASVVYGLDVLVKDMYIVLEGGVLGTYAEVKKALTIDEIQKGNITSDTEEVLDLSYYATLGLGWKF